MRLPFRFTLDNIDSYQNPPGPLDRNHSGHDPPTVVYPKVPIIRIFGTTEGGQKVMAHVHGVYPYLYVEYTGSLVPDTVQTEIHRLHTSINRAMCLSFRRNPDDVKNIYVARITLVKGVPFYGLNVGWKFYFKIYMLSPGYMTRLTELLARGMIMKRVLQPYEAHIPYLLQFMIDYNLYGCGFMKLKAVGFRQPLPEPPESDGQEQVSEGDSSQLLYNTDTVPSTLVQPSASFSRLSYSELEIDIQASAIINRTWVLPRPLHHDFTERLNPYDPTSQLVHSMRELWQDEQNRRSAKGMPSTIPTPSVGEERVRDKGWVHEEEYWEALEVRMREERGRLGGVRPRFGTWVKPTPFESLVQTAFESVKDMFLQEGPDPEELDANGIGNGSDVNVGAASSQARELATDESWIRMSGHSEAEVDEIAIMAMEQLEDADDPNDWVAKEDENVGDGEEEDEGVGLDEGRDLQQINEAEQLVDGLEDAADTPYKRRKRVLDAMQSGDSEDATPSRLIDHKRLKTENGGDLGSFSSPISKQTKHSARRHSQTSVPRSSNGVSVEGGSCTSSAEHAAVRHLATSLSIPSIALYRQRPPTSEMLLSTCDEYDLPRVVYTQPHWGNISDVEPGAREYAGKEFVIKGDTMNYLDYFETPYSALADSSSARNALDKPRSSLWMYGKPPVSRRDAVAWLSSRSIGFTVTRKPEHGISQVEGPTQKNPFGAKYTPGPANARMLQPQTQSVLSLEIHVNTRAGNHPDPKKDEVAAVIWCLQRTSASQAAGRAECDVTLGAVTVSDSDITSARFSLQAHEGTAVETELDVVNYLIDLVRNSDPDILAGFEVQSSSWGYLIERARLAYDFNLCNEFSRVREESHGRFGKDNDRWGFNHASAIRVTGRHVINIWRAMRAELNLQQYTLENITFHLLHRRIPHYSNADLSTWYTSSSPSRRARVLDYYLSRVQLNLDILRKQELVERTSEQARVLGVDFYSVFSRGSQFKVESSMFRIAKPESYMLISPTRKQVGSQNALECIPLVMEPQAKFYSDPVIVLDFQSLYPSIVIAYNYCYSTCLGRVETWRGENKMGFLDHKLPPGLLELLADDVTVAPNGFVYAKPSLRKSLLAKMLSELLDTRIMVKDSMKLHKDDKELQKLLNNRQLALKLLANVTYGYTSASFSGRMPCAEIADSIVQSGRETLEKAIEVIHSTREWGAEVVYGDTDSLFVHLPGRTKDEAFDIGYAIADTITAMNPPPVKLKFEKVYLPSVLLAKKRYVGFKYEHRNAQEPEFDAKGIETVRRDGIPAIQKMMETSLKILFRTANLSAVKRYFQRQCSKIITNRVSIQDFTFAKEVKMGTYSENGVPPPGAVISARKMAEDARAEPQYGERVPYVVVAGAPGSRIVDKAVSPEEMISNPELRLDHQYYIERTIIPPLERVFNIMGVNVSSWWKDMPKAAQISWSDSYTRHQYKSDIDSFVDRRLCISCMKREPIDQDVCQVCKKNSEGVAFQLAMRTKQAAEQNAGLQAVCTSCCAVPSGSDIRCDSRDCPVYYRRVRAASAWRSQSATKIPATDITW
ncbi:hypothetical protein SAICODRAFT_61405 [Saitoella complicata NRRL Y-17804]|nr:uncharacterized protein SAICODRAFT_61405 [Saitoella complicata NRRL Y-17804]ODQ50587.1 hypothetical protein SAICODRAFT_61405 [Saitoella complicata NRRL Y-17804]